MSSVKLLMVLDFYSRLAAYSTTTGNGKRIEIMFPFFCITLWLKMENAFAAEVKKNHCLKIKTLSFQGCIGLIDIEVSEI